MSLSISTILSQIGVAPKDNPLRFTTSVAYEASMAKMVNNITFLYDPNWVFNGSDSSTLPICFYFVRKWEEVGESNISQKPMLFYNATGIAGSQRNGAALDVVADNIITQPKEYRISVLLPFSPEEVLEQYQLDPTTINNIHSFAYAGTTDLPKAAVQTLTVFDRIINTSINLLKLVFRAMSVEAPSSLANMILSQSDINKASLDAMRDNRGILKMKLWNGWKFKYVMLKSVHISKSAEFHNFYEGSITVQEVPIVNVYQSGQISAITGKAKSLLEMAISKGLHKALQATTGAMEKAGG